MSNVTHQIIFKGFTTVYYFQADMKKRNENNQFEYVPWVTTLVYINNIEEL